MIWSGEIDIANTSTSPELVTLAIADLNCCSNPELSEDALVFTKIVPLFSQPNPENVCFAPENMTMLVFYYSSKKKLHTDSHEIRNIINGRNNCKRFYCVRKFLIIQLI